MACQQYYLTIVVWFSPAACWRTASGLVEQTGSRKPFNKGCGVRWSFSIETLKMGYRLGPVIHL